MIDRAAIDAEFTVVNAGDALDDSAIEALASLLIQLTASKDQTHVGNECAIVRRGAKRINGFGKEQAPRS